MSVNKVILVGNLGADPETRTSQSGTTIGNLRIATTERRKDGDGNWNDHTEWHRVTCFGKTAENAARYLRKGRQVYVEGKIQTRKWTDRDGNDRWTTEVVADFLVFLGGRDGGERSERSGGGARRSDRGGSSGGGGGSSRGQGGGGGYGGGGGGGYGGGWNGADDDIPF